MTGPARLMRALSALLLACASVASLTSGTASAAPAGEVLFVEGVGTVQSPGKTPQILGKGVTVDQGDTIVTASGSFAILRYADGTRMTVRPESQIVIRTYDFKPSAPETQSAGSMVFELLKGGLRTVTGLISKRDGLAASIRTPSATVGIRGTDIDLRVCTGDCAKVQEAAEGKRTPRPNTIFASARLVQLQGTADALTADGARHNLLLGAPVYPGEVVETGPGSYAVLAFRDESKVTLGGVASMKIEDFVYDAQHPEEGRFLVNLIKGGLRAFTGLVGRANHDHVGIHTASATVGIRGTGVDLYEDEKDGFTGSVWQGAILVTQTGTGEAIEVHPDEAVGFGPNDHLHRIPKNTHVFGPRPDSVSVDWHQLFGEDPLSGTESGLWMQVIKGPVHVVNLSGQALDAGDHEVLYFDFDGKAFGRPILVPLFFDADETPDPTKVLRFDLLGEIKPSGIKAVCKQ